MKNFVFASLLLLAVFVGVGVYRGWFTVDKSRIEQDEQSAKQELQNLGHKVKSKTDDLTGKSNEAGSTKRND